MYHIQKEIENQFISIKKTAEYIADMRNEIQQFFQNETKIIFIGSGSSYFLSQSAAAVFRINNLGFDTSYIAAGDLMMNFEKYESMIKGSVVVCLTRSGSTSEIIKSLELLGNIDCKKMAICAKKNAPASEYCELNLEIEWAFDESVCQTQTVSNLYSACLAVCAVLKDDNAVIEELRSLVQYKEDFDAKYKNALIKIGASERWDSAVTLADCECAGLFMEAALAFLEICQNKSSFYHVLDVRHGPIVMIDEKTLVFVLVNSNDKEYRKLLVDLKKKGAFCITAGMFSDEIDGDLHLELPKLSSFSVSAILGLYAIHIITLNKALSKGINPDKPDGLSPWIKL